MCHRLFLLSVLVLGLLGLLLPASLGAQAPPPSELRDLIAKGVEAYKAGRFEEAREFFEKSVALDPNHVRARLYLATTYASQYIPGTPSQENRQLGEKAVEQFREALRIDPANLSAIDGLGSMLYQIGGEPFDPKKFEESAKYHKLHIELRPKDPEAHYWVGVISWTITYRANQEMRAKYNKATPVPTLRDDQPLPEYLRREFEQDYAPLVDEGIEHLRKAIELREDYDDALAFLNLLYRQKGDMAPRQVEREELMQMADELVDRVMAIKKRKLQKPEAPKVP